MSETHSLNIPSLKLETAVWFSIYSYAVYLRTSIVYGVSKCSITLRLKLTSQSPLDIIIMPL
jgi:hypothetical protein